MVMHKNKSLVCALLTAAIFFVSSLPLMAWDGWECCCDPFDFAVEARVAYYHPSSSKVRRIYGDGWADYQLEISKGVFCDWRIWAGVSGFSREGDSIGFHDHTRLQLIPLSFGVKYFFPCWDDCKLYLGGAACYSFLRINDDSDYIRRHTHKNDWGGLIQAGLTYNFWDCAYVSFFVDYFFQEFRFHDSHRSSGDSYGSFYDGGYIERTNLDMSGYKLGVGLGYTF